MPCPSLGRIPLAYYSLLHKSPQEVPMILRSGVEKLPPYPAGKAQEGYLKLSSNENPRGMSPAAKRAINLHIDELSVYQDGRSTKLCQAIAGNMGLDLENVVAGNGSDEIFGLVTLAYGGQGTNILCSANTFSEYRFSTIVAGSEYREIPTIEGRYDLEAFAKNIDHQTRVVFLCTPNNPTGMIIPRTELLAFLDNLNNNVLAVVDQAYGEYVSDPSYPSPKELVEAYPNVLVTRTFSKIFGMASLRLGYGMAHETVIQDLLRVKQPFNVNRLSQEAGLAALADPEFLEESIALNSWEKNKLETFFQAKGISFYPTEANFFCIKVPESAAKAFDIIKKEGILVRDLASFDLPDYIRVTIGTADQNTRLMTALEKVFSV
jgi:histidinol-phosphate aminotransferase